MPIQGKAVGVRVQHVCQRADEHAGIRAEQLLPEVRAVFGGEQADHGRVALAEIAGLIGAEDEAAQVARAF